MPAMSVEPRPIHITTLWAYHSSSNGVAENSDIKLRKLILKCQLWNLTYDNSCTQQVSGTEMPKPKKMFFSLVAWIRLRAIHATYGKLFWLSLYVYRGRGGSVISARFILARTTTDKSNGRSGRRGQKKEEEEELGEACFILRASSMMHK